VKVLRVIATGIQAGTGAALVVTLLCAAGSGFLPPWWLGVSFAGVLVGSSAVIVAAGRA
jgi:hypothetical protein